MQQTLFQDQIHLPPLRGYQTHVLSELYTWIRDRKDEPIEDSPDCPGINRNVVLFAPTAFGKTISACRILVDNWRKSANPGLFIVPLDCLVGQTVKTFRERYGIEAGVIKAGWKPNPDAPIQVASIQTLTRRDYPDANVVVLDECHGAIANSYKPVFERYRKSWILGLTGSPLRTKRTEGLTQRFSGMVVGPYTSDLIRIGKETNWTEGLVEPIYYGSPEKLDFSDVGTVAGDFNQQQAGAICTTDAAIANMVRQFQRLAWHPERNEWRRTLIFCTGVAHSKRVAQAFNEAGILGVTAEHIDADADSEERLEKFGRIARGETTILSSVSMLTTGFDVPEIECVMLARPTKSLTMHIQICGRGLRTAPWIRKTDCIFIDLVGNFDRLDFPHLFKPTCLDDPKPISQEEAPRKECPSCHAKIVSFATRCPECDYVYPPKPLKEQLSDMVLLLSKDEKARLKKYTSLVKQAFGKGFLPSWATHQYKEWFTKHYPTEEYEHPPIAWRLGATFNGEDCPEYRDGYFKYLCRLCKTKDSWFTQNDMPEMSDRERWVWNQFALEFGPFDESTPLITGFLNRRIPEGIAS